MLIKRIDSKKGHIKLWLKWMYEYKEKTESHTAIKESTKK